MPGPSSRPRVRGSHVRRVLALVVAVLALSACQLRTQLNIAVEPDGSGRVEVVIGLDEDGVRQNPELLDQLDFSDLEAAGWTVTGPEPGSDGFTQVRVAHDFGAPEDLDDLLDQVDGGSGPFRDFRLTRSDGFARTRYRFDGVVDFTGGVAGVAADPALADALGADPVALIEQRVGGAVDQLLRVQVAVRLPGDVDSNAPTKASNGAVWRPSVLEREAVELHATSTIRRTGRLVWLGVAAAAGFALVLFVAVRLVLWRRRRGSPAGSS